MHQASRSGCFPRWYAMQLYVISLGCRSFGGLQRRWLQPLASKPENIPLQPFLTGMLVRDNRRGSSVPCNSRVAVSSASSRLRRKNSTASLSPDDLDAVRASRTGAESPSCEGKRSGNHPKRPFRHRLPECFKLIRNVHIPRRNVVRG